VRRWCVTTRNCCRLPRLKRGDPAKFSARQRDAGSDSCERDVKYHDDADSHQWWRSSIREHLKGHTQWLEDLAIEMLARGLSVRDIKDAFKDENDRELS
jgi:hypothetical protein